MFVFAFFLSVMMFTRVFCSNDCSSIVPGDSPPKSWDKDVIRIMQYNAEWLFLNHYSNFDCPGNDCSWKNTSEARTHMNHVANIIAEINPDVLNLCEVESCYELSEMNKIGRAHV